MESLKENIFLVGFSGTGKTSVGKLLARMLGYEFVDTDLQIEANTGRSVPEIFATDGEAGFRQLESEVLESVCREDYQVVSTGGGIVISATNRTKMTANGYVFCLEARPETIMVRLMLASGEPGSVRPLLQGSDSYSRITSLKASRQAFYAESDWTVHTDFLTPEVVAAEVIRALELVKRRGEKGKGGATTPAGRAAADAMVFTPPAPDSNLLEIKASNRSYNVLFAPNLLKELGSLIKTHLPGSENRAVFVITDSNVAVLYGEKTLDLLRSEGFRPTLLSVPFGEQSKSLERVAELYEKLAEARAERKDIIVALGGGVVGDLAGFVAATWLRGVPLVQVPTTLLAMVDSSVGGKTGVNLPQGKNLVGSFYPPNLVLTDVNLLDTLPEREKRSGWGEVIKHALIPGADPDEHGALKRLTRLEANLSRLQAGEAEITAAILRESVAVKAGVVAQDEHETGLRMTLNYGHTYAHGLESAGGYSLLLHGEAVAIGMHGVALLAQQLGYCDAAFVERQRNLLESFGFKLKAAVDPERALAAMGLDKKSDGGAIRWIIPEGVGRISIRRDIPFEAVREVMKELIG
ncbi:MAG: 3-dehydroquinate synthase [Chloroflexi bacterium]|uniref:Multifunctional fusion protein n=1 Tax=Candidatus Chlorohelix allophototropha TaxID=3003348 RepID=A0A8T7LY81_9CHLR|nr:3-dehydroquinate synthase [Chloroflexota bacterium]WJW66262.1 3-dehydroquinate synthase [Chloroflexota bacterium L227-S17]